MAKNKKNKRQNADALESKKSVVQPKKLNPFEIHLNKEKFKILGRKNKHDHGLPGVSRAKAQQKRKMTLGREYLEKHKTNKFKDNRIGKGGGGDNDDLATARFAAEKITQYKEKKKNIFNLNDDEVLTHRGQTLEEIEQFREPVSDESEDEGLDAEFTEATQFGGGDDENDKLDRKTAIEDLIAESKRKKAEIAKDKDEVYELTTKLDSEYKSLIPIIGLLNRREDIPKPPPDDYDRALREMIFEPRGTVSDKLMSEEETQKKEKERLEKLEQDRLARMRGEDPDAIAKPTHRSADALDDAYMIASDNDDDDEPTLAYDVNGDLNEEKDADDGQNFDETLGDDKLENRDDDSAPEVEEDSNEDEADSNEDNEDEESDEDGEEEEESDEDSLNDLKYSDTESEIEDTKETETEAATDSKGKQNIKENAKQKKQKRKSCAEASEEIEMKRKKAEKQLPFTFVMPSSYEDLLQLLEKHTPKDQGTIVERIIKCNHPKVDASNKENMVKLFTYLLQYVNDLFSDSTEMNIEQSFVKFDKMSPHIYDLVQMVPERTVACILEVIKEKYEEYKKNPKMFPPLETAIFFKLVSNIFSTSDFRHPVVSPCFIFMSHILSRARARNRKDLATGLLLVTITLEYTILSKRFLPAAVNYLLGIIFLSVHTRPIEITGIIPPFQSRGPQSNLLALSDKFTDDIVETKLSAVDLVKTEIEDSFKVRALNNALIMLNDFIENTSENVGIRFIVEPFPKWVERIDLDLYPEFIKESLEKVQKSIEIVNEKPLLLLVKAEKKPKALRLMEPKIVPVYDDKRRPALSKDKEMRAILAHKLKRETKGAIREIRKDNEFITKMQIKKQIQSDKERKDKVRKIFSEASLQQGELKALERSKKKHKF